MSPILDFLAEARVVAVLRSGSAVDTAIDNAIRLREAGVRAFECTLDNPDALRMIQALRIQLGDTCRVGAGTVTTVQQVERLAELDAAFLMTPHLDPDVVSTAIEYGLTVVPGVMTPTEISAAFRLGVEAVKLFPAGSLGIEYLQTLQGPFGRFPVIPTGGIGLAEAARWLEAGALCVGLGSALVASPLPHPALNDLLGVEPTP